ncbi:hypothetical protein DPSP01_012908 [Paraphaeosphaeria sporulosa]
MEKYSQFRDKGTAIAPFLPIPSPPASLFWTPIHAILFAVRLFPVLSISLFYFLLLEILPIPTTLKKCVLWLLLAVPGVWWVDLQVDGVKRGRLSDKQAAGALPSAGDVVASSFTSPLDPLYLAGIFHPVFVRTWPAEKGVQVITLWGAICMAFSRPQIAPPPGTKLVQLSELSKRYPDSIICVFPESTTTNGRGILPLSPALLTLDPTSKIYPVNLRYTPGDITTPVPGAAANWVWKLLSKPTHQMRVRIARPLYNSTSIDTPRSEKANASAVDKNMGYETNIWDSPGLRNGLHAGWEGKAKGEEDGQKVLDRVGEDLARLGRVKRVGLGLKEKVEFVKVWKSRRR